MGYRNEGDMSPLIDQDALDLLARKHRAWWVKYGQELSPTYVSGEGDNPAVLIVGEAPGAVEETRRRPFVGDAGIILRRLMEIAGLRSQPVSVKQANCWLTNVVKFRPPRNRTPYWIEVKSVRHLLREEWEVVGKPSIVVPVGAIALSAILGKQTSILTHAGKHFSIKNQDEDEMVIWPMIHPSFAIREESVRPVVEKHWGLLNDWLAQNGYQ